MIRKEFVLFLVVGVLTALMDYVAYSTTTATGLLAIHQATILGFVTSTMFSYSANRTLTFGDYAHARGSKRRFATLYALTLLINVSVNSIMLGVLSNFQNPVLGAFVIATGLSAAFNFGGMKYFVFIKATPVETV